MKSNLKVLRGRWIKLLFFVLEMQHTTSAAPVKTTAQIESSSLAVLEGTSQTECPSLADRDVTPQNESSSLADG